MVKELVFECDMCLSREEHAPATHVAVRVVIGQVGPVLIDVCDRDYNALFDNVIQTLAKHGYREEKPAKQKKSA